MKECSSLFMDSPFVYPSSLDDLLNRNSDRFCVCEIISADQLEKKFAEFMDQFDSSDMNSIAINFDLFFAIVKNIAKLDLSFLVTVWRVLLRYFQQYANYLSQFLDLYQDERTLSSSRSTLYMMATLLNTLANEFEDNSVKQADRDSLKDIKKGQNRRGKQVVQKSLQGLKFDWLDARRQLMKAYQEILSPQMAELFQAVPADERMINALCSLCVRFLKSWDPSIEESLFGVILILVAKPYDFSAALGVQCVHCLSNPNANPEVIVNLVEEMVNQDLSRSFVTSLLTEFAKIDCSELASEGVGVKNYGALLVKLAERLPDVVLRGLPILVVFLSKESNTLRNGILTAYCELLLKKVSKENLDPRQVKLRDQLLNTLLRHIHDRNAFVRAKALNLWLRLCSANCIPLAVLRELQPLVTGRLLDKGVIVRKAAVQLLTELLKRNPFMINLSVDTLKEHLSAAKAKLVQLEEDCLQNEDEWSKVCDDAAQAVDLVYELYTKDGPFEIPAFEEEGQEEPEIESTSPDFEIRKIFALILDANFEEAVVGLVRYCNQFSSNNYVNLNLHADLTLENFKEQLMPQLKIFYQGLQKTDVELHAIDKEEAATLYRNPALEEFCKKKGIVKYLEDSLTFASNLVGVVPNVKLMLRQNQISDVVEALDFVITCAKHGIASPISDCWECWVLIFSNQRAIRKAVMDRFCMLYFKASKNARYGSQRDAKQMVRLWLEAPKNHLLTLEFMLEELFNDNILDATFIRSCWELFYTSDLSEKERKALLSLLGMMIRGDPKIFIEHIDHLVSYGLGDKVNGDFELGEIACCALKKLGHVDRAKCSKHLEAVRQEFSRLQVFARVTNLLTNTIAIRESCQWVPMMRQVLEMIFNIASRPDVIAVKVLHLCFEKTVHNADCDKLIGLSRLIALIGEVALRTLYMADVTLVSVMKEDNRDQKSKSSNEATPKNKSKTNSISSVVSEAQSTHVVIGDSERLIVRALTEAETICPSSVLGKFSSVVLTVCRNPKEYSHEALQNNAGMALIKLMLISSNFCASNVPVLFHMLEASPHASLRKNILLYLPDLYVRFPNEMEQWTGKVFGRLFDADDQVRCACLVTLNHLISQDTIKTKGFVADIAICSLDENVKLANLARSFFKAYAARGLLFFNALPDIISRLSCDESPVNFDNFKMIMTWLFNFIKKDKQLENLIEKFCKRFVGLRSKRQCRNLSFCLTVPNYTERMLKKLDESFMCYASKLGDKIVFANFITLVDNAKKGLKAEAKVKLEELKKRLQETHDKYLNRQLETSVSSQLDEAQADREQDSLGHQTPEKRPVNGVKETESLGNTLERRSTSTTITSSRRRISRRLCNPDAGLSPAQISWKHNDFASLGLPSCRSSLASEKTLIQNVPRSPRSNGVVVNNDEAIREEDSLSDAFNPLGETWEDSQLEVSSSDEMAEPAPGVSTRRSKANESTRDKESAGSEGLRRKSRKRMDSDSERPVDNSNRGKKKKATRANISRDEQVADSSDQNNPEELCSTIKETRSGPKKKKNRSSRSSEAVALDKTEESGRNSSSSPPSRRKQRNPVTSSSATPASRPNVSVRLTRSTSGKKENLAVSLSCAPETSFTKKRKAKKK